MVLEASFSQAALALAIPSTLSFNTLFSYHQIHTDCIFHTGFSNV